MTMTRLNAAATIVSAAMVAALANGGAPAAQDAAPAPLVLENSRFRFAVNPIGSRVLKLHSKDIAAELTDSDMGGSFMEFVWSIPSTRQYLRDKPFALREKRGERGLVEVTAEGHALGYGANFLTVRKTYSTSDDSAAFRVDYSFGNLPAAMSALPYGFLLHTSLGLLGEEFSHYYPTSGGIMEIKPGKRPLQMSVEDPSDGWIAVADGKGRGVAVSAPFRDVQYFYSWFSKDKIPTLEWKLIPVSVPCGGAFNISMDVLPFNGLNAVSGAGGGFAGEIRAPATGTAGATSMPVEVRVVAAKAGKADVTLRVRTAGSGDWKEVAAKTLAFDKPGALASFTAEVKTGGSPSPATADARERVPPAASLELQALVSQGGAAAARLNAFVRRAGDSNARWRIDPPEARRKSAIPPIDLTGSTNYVASVKPVTPWAKPLAGGPLRVIALTGRGNNLEIGRLKEHFDIVPLTTHLDITGGSPRKFSNPVYADGDNYGLVGVKDINANLVKLLKEPCEAILVGGIPWESWPDEARNMLLKRVRDGVGLVWIGEEKDAPELGLVNRRKKSVKAVPHVATTHFADVPFDLLGAEDAYAFDAPTGGVVHATVDGFPYLAESRIGKGRVFTLSYRAIFGYIGSNAGFTPNLREAYRDRGTAAEWYHLLISKCLLAASGRETQIALKQFNMMADNTLSVRAMSKSPLQTFWKWDILNRWGATLASGAVIESINAGENSVTLGRPELPQYAGPLVLRLTVREATGAAGARATDATKRVPPGDLETSSDTAAHLNLPDFISHAAKGPTLNWGAWTLPNEPDATLESFATDEDHVDDGGEVHFTAKVSGKTEGKSLRISLVDSFGRTLEEKTLPATPEVNGAMHVENALVSRHATLVARLIDGETEVDRLDAFVIVRPDPAKWPWDDFEIGAWVNDGVREYLWPEVANIYRGMELSLLIANPYRMETEFPARHNFSPTMLSGAGLGQCAEPPEYAKTGDKMVLVRKPCLSDPEFLGKQREGKLKTGEDIRRYGMRFVWFGDEQSLTGYSGKAIDFCFSPHCLAAFRIFLKKRYGSLDALNAEWETQFTSWEAVMPFTRQEIWDADGRHVAGWADHLEFMDGRLAASLENASAALQEKDPNLHFSISGTQAPTAYGGMDWWRQLRVLDCTMNYNEGGQYEIHRSFLPDGGTMPWAWGYSAKGPAAVNKVWRPLFIGCRGIMGFQSKSMLRGDGTWTQGLADTMPAISRIASGVGKHLINNLKPRPDVAILYSQASIRAAFIEKRDKEHQALRMKYIAMLRNLGFCFDFVSYEQLAAGALADGGYKTLLLPDSTALSDAEISAIRAFAAKGGKVVAEGRPATRKANCRPRAAGMLDNLFNDGRHTLFPEIDTRYTKAMEHPEIAENSAIVEVEQNRLMKALALNVPRLAITDAKTGEQIRHAEIYTREGADGTLFFGVVANDRPPRDVVYTFPKDGFVRDLVTGEEFGQTNRLVRALGVGCVHAFEITPVPVRIANVEAKPDSHVRIDYARPCRSIAVLRVFRPDGTEAECYRRKLIVRDGAAETRIPFALSDPKGRWTIEVRDICGKLVRADCGVK